MKTKTLKEKDTTGHSKKTMTTSHTALMQHTQKKLKETQKYSVSPQLSTDPQQKAKYN